MIEENGQCQVISRELGLCTHVPIRASRIRAEWTHDLSAWHNLRLHQICKNQEALKLAAGAIVFDMAPTLGPRKEGSESIPKKIGKGLVVPSCLARGAKLTRSGDGRAKIMLEMTAKLE